MSETLAARPRTHTRVPASALPAGGVAAAPLFQGVAAGACLAFIWAAAIALRLGSKEDGSKEETSNRA